MKSIKKGSEHIYLDIGEWVVYSIHSKFTVYSSLNCNFLEELL